MSLFCAAFRRAGEPAVACADVGVHLSRGGGVAGHHGRGCRHAQHRALPISPRQDTSGQCCEFQTFEDASWMSFRLFLHFVSVVSIQSSLNGRANFTEEFDYPTLSYCSIVRGQRNEGPLPTLPLLVLVLVA